MQAILVDGIRADYRLTKMSRGGIPRHRNYTELTSDSTSVVNDGGGSASNIAPDTAEHPAHQRHPHSPANDDPTTSYTDPALVAVVWDALSRANRQPLSPDADRFVLESVSRRMWLGRWASAGWWRSATEMLAT